VRTAEDGEILVCGPTVAHGTRASDGWLHSGDLGELDEQGRLSVTGRKADTIVSGGENVAPAEVEAALESHPLVLEAGVFSRPDARWGELVCALVVPRAGAQPALEDLREHCARLLAPYKVPKSLFLVAAPLPRTASGKLLRRQLSERSGAV
jgi:O-succinylbenzoic acid--CoA ligase